MGDLYFNEQPVVSAEQCTSDTECCASSAEPCADDCCSGTAPAAGAAPAAAAPAALPNTYFNEPVAAAATTTRVAPPLVCTNSCSSTGSSSSSSRSELTLGFAEEPWWLAEGREVAETRLSNCAQNAFAVRPSSTPDCFAVSLFFCAPPHAKRKLKHLLLRRTAGGYRLDSRRFRCDAVFPTVPDFVRSWATLADFVPVGRAARSQKPMRRADSRLGYASGSKPPPAPAPAAAAAAPPQLDASYSAYVPPAAGGDSYTSFVPPFARPGKK